MTQIFCYARGFLLFLIAKKVSFFKIWTCIRRGLHFGSCRLQTFLDDFGDSALIGQHVLASKIFMSFQTFFIGTTSCLRLGFNIQFVAPSRPYLTNRKYFNLRCYENGLLCSFCIYLLADLSSKVNRLNLLFIFSCFKNC